MADFEAVETIDDYELTPEIVQHLVGMFETSLQHFQRSAKTFINNYKHEYTSLQLGNFLTHCFGNEIDTMVWQELLSIYVIHDDKNELLELVKWKQLWTAFDQLYQSDETKSTFIHDCNRFTC